MLLGAFEVFVVLGVLGILPLTFGISLLILFLVYCVLFAWLALFPIFSWHFSVMSKVWSWGLSIVSNKKTWILAGIGAVFIFIANAIGM